MPVESYSNADRVQFGFERVDVGGARQLQVSHPVAGWQR